MLHTHTRRQKSREEWTGEGKRDSSFLAARQQPCHHQENGGDRGQRRRSCNACVLPVATDKIVAVVEERNEGSVCETERERESVYVAWPLSLAK